MNKKLKSEAKRVESKERREKQFKKESVDPVRAAPNRYHRRRRPIIRITSRGKTMNIRTANCG